MSSGVMAAQSEDLGHCFTPLHRSPPLYTPPLGSLREGGPGSAISGLSWLSARQGLWAPRPEWSSMLPLVCPPPEAEDTAQCPVLAEPPSHSQL